MSDVQAQRAVPGVAQQPDCEPAPLTRFDPPHVASGEWVDDPPQAASEQLLKAGAGQSGTSSDEQLHLQAGQLAAHLQSRQRDLDLRETQLNARLAQLENQLRAARLWVGQREQELAEQQRELQNRHQQLDRRQAELEATAQHLQRPEHPHQTERHTGPQAGQDPTALLPCPCRQPLCQWLAQLQQALSAGPTNPFPPGCRLEPAAAPRRQSAPPT